MIDLLIELLANRLGVLILGVLFIGGGYYTWQNYRFEASKYDAATGSEGKTVTGNVVWKNVERSQSEYRDNVETVVPYINIEFDHAGEEHRVKVYVDSDEYDRRTEGEPIEVKYHPGNLEYVVIPYTKRESVWLSSFFAIVLIAIGAIIIVAVLFSFL